VIGRFATASEAALRAEVAKSLLNKGAALRRLGRAEEAIAACDEALARFGTANDAGLQASVAKSLANKAVTLADLGRIEEAIAVCDMIAQREAATQPEIAALVDHVRALQPASARKPKQPKSKKR
jgi:tetratricopeptide (TPR) repeat protein